MTKGSFSRVSMLVSGILAAMVILLSQAIHTEASTYLSKIKTEHSEKANGSDQKVLIATPADAVTTGQAEVETPDFSLIREIILEEAQLPEHPVLDEHTFIGLSRTLLRTVISPQAP